MQMRFVCVPLCLFLCVCGNNQPQGEEDKNLKPTTTAPKINDSTCLNCEKRHIINVDEDFNKLKTDPELKNHVSAILDRLKTFKIPVHPRIRLFHELLKVGMSEYAHRTADSLYVPDKYNKRLDAT